MGVVHLNRREHISRLVRREASPCGKTPRGSFVYRQSWNNGLINFQHQAIESILLFVALGKGITIVPEYFLPCAPAGINLLFILLEDSALPAEVAAIWQEKNTNPALDKFVECIQKD